jgi:hypothetical protein
MGAGKSRFRAQQQYGNTLGVAQARSSSACVPCWTVRAAVARRHTSGDALTIGTFELTPAEMVRLAATVGAGLASVPADVRNPSIIERITMLEADGKARILVRTADVPSIATSEIRGMFTPRVKSFVASVLQATSDENGTLSLLNHLREEFGGRLYAKTGTVSVAGSTQGLHIAGTFLREGKPWSFVVTAGGPSGNRPLGTKLVAGRLAPLAALAACGTRLHQSNVTLASPR